MSQLECQLRICQEATNLSIGGAAQLRTWPHTARFRQHDDGRPPAIPGANLQAAQRYRAMRQPHQRRAAYPVTSTHFRTAARLQCRSCGGRETGSSLS